MVKKEYIATIYDLWEVVLNVSEGCTILSCVYCRRVLLVLKCVFLCVSAVCLEIAQHAAHGAKANEHIVRWRIEDQARASHQVIKYRALANRQVTIASTKALFVRSPLNAISFGQYLLFC